MEQGIRDLAISALSGLLGAYRAGKINDLTYERVGWQQHMAALSQRWDQRFPGFPDQYFPFTGFRGEFHRGKRDAYLRRLVVELVGGQQGPGRTIVNPACVFGRHARDLARRLSNFEVIATDIDWHWNWWYKRFRPTGTPDNFRFVQDDIFAPRLEARPAAVVFFGACGAVSDAAIDYAIDTAAPYLMCRTCCHENIAGNTTVTRRRTCLNAVFRLKNSILVWMRRQQRFRGYYFSERYGPEHYPRSQAARQLTTAAELIAISRDSTESDICRAIIDLDRVLHLCEAGYDVWYKGELLVAQRAR